MSELRHIALGVIVKDGKVLVVRRQKTERGLNNETLTWVFPGGKVEDNETVLESVVREVLEETGYNVKTISTINEGQHPTFPAYMSYVACELVDDTVSDVREKEIAEVKWVSISEFQNIITSSLNNKVKDYLAI
ncbi:MAG: NUDIX hydrolase [Patescibacteria group bacterium]